MEERASELGCGELEERGSILLRPGLRGEGTRRGANAEADGMVGHERMHYTASGLGIVSCRVEGAGCRPSRDPCERGPPRSMGCDDRAVCRPGLRWWRPRGDRSSRLRGQARGVPHGEFLRCVVRRGDPSGGTAMRPDAAEKESSRYVEGGSATSSLKLSIDPRSGKDLSFFPADGSSSAA